MGFGLFFIGYITLLLFKVIPIEPIGFFVMYLASDKLCAAEKRFCAVKYSSVFMFFVSVLDSIGWITKYTSLPIGLFDSDTFYDVKNTVYYVGLLVFHAFLYIAIIAISEKTGYKKGRIRAKVNAGIAAVFYILQTAVQILPFLREKLASPLMMIQLLWLLSTAFMLFCCYAMIVNDSMLEAEEEKYNKFLEKSGRYNKNAGQNKKHGKGKNASGAKSRTGSEKNTPAENKKQVFRAERK